MADHRTTLTRVGALLVSALLPASTAAEVVDRRTTVAASGEVTQLSEAGLLAVENRNAVSGALLDADGDGRTDVLVVHRLDVEPPLLYLSRPEGQLQEDGAARLPGLPGGVSAVVATADFNADGWTDVFLGRTPADALWLADGAGGFRDATAVWLPAGTGGTVQAAASDFTGDGLPDIVVLRQGRASLLENVRGLGLREVVLELSLVAEGTSHLAAADADADGDADLFAASETHFSLALQGGAGRWERIVRPNPGGLPVSGVSAVDVDGDGAAECIVSRDDRPVLLSYLAGRWRLTHLPQLPGPAASPAAADFNGDGRIDLFFPVIGVDALFLQEEEGRRWTLATHWVAQDHEAGRWAAVLDANFDGHTDLYIANDGQDSFYLQQPSP